MRKERLISRWGGPAPRHHTQWGPVRSPSLLPATVACVVPRHFQGTGSAPPESKLVWTGCARGPPVVRSCGGRWIFDKQMLDRRALPVVQPPPARSVVDSPSTRAHDAGRAPAPCPRELSARTQDRRAGRPSSPVGAVPKKERLQEDGRLRQARARRPAVLLACIYNARSVSRSRPSAAAPSPPITSAAAAAVPAQTTEDSRRPSCPARRRSGAP